MYFRLLLYWKVDTDIETKWLADLLLNEFANRFVSDFFSSFLGRLTLTGFL